MGAGFLPGWLCLRVWSGPRAWRVGYGPGLSQGAARLGTLTLSHGSYPEQQMLHTGYGPKYELLALVLSSAAWQTSLRRKDGLYWARVKGRLSCHIKHPPLLVLGLKCLGWLLSACQHVVCLN